MAEKFNWQLFCDEGGEPWALFVFGHMDPRALRKDEAGMREAVERMCGVIDGLDLEEIVSRKAEIGHHYIRLEGDEADETPWRFCEPNDDGATLITGVRF